MSIPTPEELGELVYGVMREASGSIPFAPGLNALTELIGITVRDAVLEGAAQKAEHPMIGYGESDDEGQAVADWLRSLKGDQP